MLHYLIRTVFVYVAGLFLVYIKSDAKEFVKSDTLDKLVRIYKSASRCIYKYNSVLHLLDVFDIDHMIGGVHQRTVERNKIRPLKQFVQRYIFRKLQKIRVLIYIVSDYLHTEASADPCHSSAYLTRSDDSRGLSVEINSP